MRIMGISGRVDHSRQSFVVINDILSMYRTSGSKYIWDCSSIKMVVFKTECSLKSICCIGHIHGKSQEPCSITVIYVCRKCTVQLITSCIEEIGVCYKENCAYSVSFWFDLFNRRLLHKPSH